MQKTKIVLLFGGKSGEHEVSIVSAFSVRKALNSSLYDVTMIGIDKQGRWVWPEESFLQAAKDNPRDLKLSEVKRSVGIVPGNPGSPLVVQGTGALIPVDVFVPILHGTNGEDGVTQGILELADKPYVGSGVLGSAIGMDKDFAKRIWQAAKIPLVPWQTVMRHQWDENSEAVIGAAEKQFGFPFFVKPANSGSSVGVHKAKDHAGAKLAIQDAFRYDVKILIEKAIAARELEISVLGNELPKASLVGEIVPTHEFYSYEAKYLDENGAGLFIPARELTPAQTQKIQEWAVLAFQKIGLAGLARVDFFMDKSSGELYLNEVNTMPGFTSISMYPKMWEASGLPYSKLLDELVSLAKERHQKRSTLETSFSPST